MDLENLEEMASADKKEDKNRVNFADPAKRLPLDYLSCPYCLTSEFESHFVVFAHSAIVAEILFCTRWTPVI